ncbi:MAG: EAL domain-containing protein [Hyphomicrobiales bacterium]|nr:EAL domain-containing protein [Hyphomicrobiales bacterium]
MARALQFLVGAGLSPDTRAALLRAQSQAFSKQVPLMYLIASVDVAIGWYAIYGKIAGPLATYAPAGLIVASAIRMLMWWKRRDAPTPTTEAALRRRLHVTTALAAGLGFGFAAWTMTIFVYGDETIRLLSVGAFGITAISCVFLLVNVPIAALTLNASAIVVFSCFLIAVDGGDLAPLGVCLLLVSVAIAYMTLRSARDFADMIAAQVEAQRLSDMNLRLANIDSLTELPNRRQFFDRLAQCVERHRRGGKFYVGVLDLDGFKPVNDVFGHIIGDRVLVECAARFRAAIGDRYFVARLGGDEFGLIIENVDDDAAVIEIGNLVCGAIRVPFTFDDAIATLSASIGFAEFPLAADSPRQLYERSDYALYYAKQNARGEPAIFSLDHENQMKGVAVIEQCLRRADLDSELVLHFQPLYHVSSGQLVGFEALARWISPELGLVAPDKFIRVAERSEIIYAVTRVLLRKALDAALSWPSNLRLSFNLSARDLISPVAITQIVALIESSAFPANRIDLEITETALMTDFDCARLAIHELKRVGVRISLDDFGSGYSSLSYVHRLPLDKIKIDRSFVQEMEASDLARDIVKTLVAMCRNLKLDCVTEGIETSEQLRLLKSFGCTLAQGYFFSKPIPQQDVGEYIATIVLPALSAPKPLLTA